MGRNGEKSHTPRTPGAGGSRLPAHGRVNRPRDGVPGGDGRSGSCRSRIRGDCPRGEWRHSLPLFGHARPYIIERHQDIVRLRTFGHPGNKK